MIRWPLDTAIFPLTGRRILSIESLNSVPIEAPGDTVVAGARPLGSFSIAAALALAKDVSTKAGILSVVSRSDRNSIQKSYGQPRLVFNTAPTGDKDLAISPLKVDTTGGNWEVWATLENRSASRYFELDFPNQQQTKCSLRDGKGKVLANFPAVVQPAGSQLMVAPGQKALGACLLSPAGTVSGETYLVSFEFWGFPFTSVETKVVAP